MKSCTSLRSWSFMILFPLEPPAGTWQMTALKKKHHLSNPPFFKGFHMSFVPELYNTPQESPKCSAIHGRTLSFKFPPPGAYIFCPMRSAKRRSWVGRWGTSGEWQAMSCCSYFCWWFPVVLLFVEVMFVACILTDQASLTLFCLSETKTCTFIS